MADEMTMDEMSAMWPDLVALRPRKVVFTGGEPLLRPDILDLLNGLKAADTEHHVVRCLNTNGHLVTRELARQLVGLADEVRVSLDALPERNDAMRGRGNFEAAMRALECYYAVGFEPKVLVTITSMSLPDLEELICFLVKRRFRRINLNGFRPIGRGEGHGDWTPNPADIKAMVSNAWRRSHPAESEPVDPPAIEPSCNCGVGRFLNILPNGDVFPCHVLTQPEFRCGNVRKERLLHICSRGGLIGTLARLDFRELVKAEGRLAPLTKKGACMGGVYAKTSDLPVWRERINVIGGFTPGSSSRT